MIQCIEGEHPVPFPEEIITLPILQNSKEFELEADALGTIITSRAGYQPVVGAQFFNRIPDPGNRFLGTHPPNSQRIATVERTAAGL